MTLHSSTTMPSIVFLCTFDASNILSNWKEFIRNQNSTENSSAISLQSHRTLEWDLFLRLWALKSHTRNNFCEWGWLWDSGHGIRKCFMGHGVIEPSPLLSRCWGPPACRLTPPTHAPCPWEVVLCMCVVGSPYSIGYLAAATLHTNYYGIACNVFCRGYASHVLCQVVVYRSQAVTSWFQFGSTQLLCLMGL